MRFLADMGVHRRVVDWLEEQGYEVAHLSDLGLHTLPDPQIFEKAVAEGRVVLTFDLHCGGCWPNPLQPLQRGQS